MTRLTALFFKEFKITIFDPQFAKGIGLPVTFFNGVLLFLVVAVVVIGIQMVGVVLIAALLITPPISARYWTDRLGLMTIIAGIFGAISGVSGAVLSTVAELILGLNSINHHMEFSVGSNCRFDHCAISTKIKLTAISLPKIDIY